MTPSPAGMVPDPNEAPRGRAVRILLRWAPAAFWMGLIFYQSHRPSLAEILPEDWAFYAMDKVAHAIVYAILGSLLIRGIAPPGAPPSGRRRALAAGLASLYGATDELHQALHPFRSCELGDWVADSAGALLGAFLARRGRSR